VPSNIDRPVTPGAGASEDAAGVGTPPPPVDDERTRIAPAIPTPVPPSTAAAASPVPRPVTGGGASADEITQRVREGEPPATPARADEGQGDEEDDSLPDTLPGVEASGAPTMRQVGRYLIVERLGRGGMATVFKAHDPGIGRDVALKFLHASLCEDEQYRGRFLREARAAGGLSHPNIVTVYDVGEVERRPYMAMELLTGESLSDMMETGGQMPVREVVVMGIQIARALDYAHAHHIVHRDIKPGNIVRVKGTSTVKVLDFGIAHIDSPNAGEQHTRVGDVLGTPQYMSPEQTLGQKLDGRSDLFSAGIVFYQMLTGQRPFTGESSYAVQYKITHSEPTPIEQLRPGVPVALRRVVERCLAKPPERRFQSGRELSEALTQVLTELDEDARNKLKPRIVPLRVKWAAMMAVIVAVVMALAATVITQRQNAALLKQVTDYGASLARFIAAQNASAALSEDWPGVEVAIQEMMKTGDFRSITVIDRGSVVRAAADQALIDRPYAPSAAAQPLGRRDGGVMVSRYAVDGEPVLGFEAPITFAGRNVGRVALGLAEGPLAHVARLSMGLMAALVVVTVLAVAIAMYFVANWFARPIKLVNQAMGEIAKGRFDYRIAEHRKDEFGLLYAGFDRMAQALQDRQPGGLRGGPPTPTPVRVATAPDDPATPMPLDDRGPLMSRPPATGATTVPDTPGDAPPPGAARVAPGEEDRGSSS
jgi:serine/threonine-protein kinase